jgi:aflatoxin B1 aldehyde reductase
MPHGSKFQKTIKKLITLPQLNLIEDSTFNQLLIQDQQFIMSEIPSCKPRVILGLMTFGPDPSLGARITSLDEFGECLDYLKSSGYSEVDTARMYLGEKQEEFTAAVGWKERGLSLATKVYPTKPGIHKPAQLREKFTESLVALKTDQVEIFYLHAADRSVPFAETLEEVNKLYQEGKFKQLGLSNYTSFEVAEIVILCTERGWVRPTIYQAMYNAISRPFPARSETPSIPR